MMPIVPVTKRRWRGVVALSLVAIIMLMANSRILKERNSTPERRNTLEANNSVAATPPNLRWGKFGIGAPTVSYPNRWIQIRELFRRLRARFDGTPLYIGSTVRLDDVITAYVVEQIPRPNNFTVYYSPGLDGETTWIAPITKTNLGQMRAIAAPLPALLAFNGFTMVTLNRNVIKIFPTSMANVYSNAPINEAGYP